MPDKIPAMGWDNILVEANLLENTCSRDSDTAGRKTFCENLFPLLPIIFKDNYPKQNKTEKQNKTNKQTKKAAYRPTIEPKIGGLPVKPLGF